MGTALPIAISDFDLTVDQYISKRLTDDSSQAIIVITLCEGSSSKHSKVKAVEGDSSREIHGEACKYSDQKAVLLYSKQRPE